MSEGNKPQDIKDRTFAFALGIIRFCTGLKSSNFILRRLCQQLLDSGTSIGANVEEAQAGQSRADFISKLNIALKEARETVYWLRLLSACDPADKNCAALRQEAEEVARIIAAIIVNTRARPKRK